MELRSLRGEDQSTSGVGSRATGRRPARFELAVRGGQGAELTAGRAFGYGQADAYGAPRQSSTLQGRRRAEAATNGGKARSTLRHADALVRPEVQLLTLTGRAGTGKTLLALAAALEQRRLYHQIYLARPVVPLGNRDIGFLPGDVKSELDPYMQPLWDNISVIRHRLSPRARRRRPSRR